MPVAPLIHVSIGFQGQEEARLTNVVPSPQPHGQSYYLWGASVSTLVHHMLGPRQQRDVGVLSAISTSSGEVQWYRFARVHSVDKENVNHWHTNLMPSCLPALVAQPILVHHNLAQGLSALAARDWMADSLP